MLVSSSGKPEPPLRGITLAFTMRTMGELEVDILCGTAGPVAF
jgi:hypothetical protein